MRPHVGFSVLLWSNPEKRNLKIQANLIEDQNVIRRMEYTAYKKQKDLDLFSMEERGLR